MVYTGVSKIIEVNREYTNLLNFLIITYVYLKAIWWMQHDV